MQLLQRLTKIPLWLLFLLSFVGAVGLVLWFPLLPAYQQAPPLDIRSFAPSANNGLVYAVLLCVLFALNGLAAWQVWVQKRPLSLKQLCATAVSLGIPYLFIYPINANDIYRYVIRGRITSFYSENPFLMPPTAFPTDPFTPFAGEWASVTTPYGPLWELVAGGLTLLSGDNLLLGLLVFKLLGLAALVATAVLLYFLCQSSPAPLRFAIPLLWAWNPALLLMFVGDGHNDGLMLFLLLLGYFSMQRGRGLVGFWIMVLAALVKPIALLALPIFFLALLRDAGNGRQKMRFVLLSSFGSLLLLWLSFLPFDSPLLLLERLIDEAAAGAGFSVATFIFFATQTLGLSLSITQIGQISLLLFALAVLILLWLTWRGRAAARSTGDIFAAYILQALNFRIWYAVWPYPWLLVDSLRENTAVAGYRLRVGWWFLLTTQLSVLIYGHLRIFALSGSHQWAHLIGVPFTFGLPFLLAKWSPHNSP